MQCHPTRGEHRGNTVVGEDRQPHSTCSHRDKDTHQAPQAQSALCASTGVLLSAISCAKSQLLQYSREGRWISHFYN